MDAAAMRRKLTPFLRRYVANFQRALEGKVDTEAVSAAFAEYFVGAGPAGVRGGKNGVKFRFMLGRGFAFYRKIGTLTMEVAKLGVTRLDDLHALARVTFRTSVRRRSDGKLVRMRFTNLYFVQLAPRAAPKIFAYVTGDEQGLMKQHGLL